MASTTSLLATFSYSSFLYTQVTSNRYATPLPSPLSFQTPYAPAFAEASTLLPANLTYTTYSLDPDATSSEDGPYGQSAYASLWVNYTYPTPPPFTSTVSPTPVPTSELVFPPTLYNAPEVPQNESLLPSDFIWGVAGSAWQIEGGLQIEGRGPSKLDFLGAVQYPGSGNDSNTADMNYLLYKQDITRLAAIGIPFYSFSISWTRIVPFGIAGSPVNTQGLEHYDDVINTCLEHGITPIVTLLHVDYPLLTVIDSASFRDDFLYYAKQVLTRYADRVPIWFTMNEPNFLFALSNSMATTTPLLLAHADVYHWYKSTLHGTGKLSLKLANLAAMPLNPSAPADVRAALRYQDFWLGTMANPLYLGAQYPATVLATPGLGLDPLTDDERAYLNGTSDLFAVDAYVAQLATPAPDEEGCPANNASDPLWPVCVVLSSTQVDGWSIGLRSNDYSYVAPQYVRQQLGYVWNVFRPSGGVMVTEFGFPVYGEAQRAGVDQRMDVERSLYYLDFLAEMVKAISEDGVNVIGALGWSVLDNNEFGSYEQQYGMQTVDRTDGMLMRRFKRSIFDFVDFFHAHVGLNE